MTFDQYEEAIARVAVAAFVLGCLLGAAAIVCITQWVEYGKQQHTRGIARPERDAFPGWWWQQRRRGH